VLESTMTDIHVLDLDPQSGAGIEVFARWPDVVPTIHKTFDRLCAPGTMASGHGHNFILYSNWTKEAGTLLIGVLDRQPGGADPDVKAAWDRRSVSAANLLEASHEQHHHRTGR
jgi:hypothetical protein